MATQDDFSSMFNDIEDFLAHELTTPSAEIVDGPPTISVYDDREAMDDPEIDFDLTGVVNEKMIPLATEVCEVCEKIGIPFQITIIAAKDGGKISLNCATTSAMIDPRNFAASAIYRLPHAISHFVAQVVAMSPPVMVALEKPDKFFDHTESYKSSIIPILNSLLEIAAEHNIPFQWGSVVSRLEIGQIAINAGAYNERKVLTCQMAAAQAVYQLNGPAVSDVLELSAQLSK